MERSPIQDDAGDDIHGAVAKTIDAIERHIQEVCDDLPVGPDSPDELRQAVREDLEYVARNPGEYAEYPEAYCCDEYRVVAADREHRGVVDARLSDYDYDAETLLRLTYSRACESDWDWALDEDGGVARVVPRQGGDAL